MFIKKEDLKNLINEAVTEALTVRMTREKHRDEETGQPLSHPEVITEDVFLPSYISQVLPYHEGALRGVQEQTGKQSGEINQALTQIETMGQILLQTEQSILKIVETAGKKGIEHDKSDNQTGSNSQIDNVPK